MTTVLVTTGLILNEEEAECLDNLLNFLDDEWLDLGTPQEGSDRDLLRKALQRGLC